MLPPVIIIPAYQPNVKLITTVEKLLELSENKIIIVDDGSSDDCQDIFNKLQTKSNVDVVRHATNLGKGQALKTGFNHFLVNYSKDSPGVVTADADGQHLPVDIIKVSTQLQKSPHALVLGVRQFDKEIPFRSKFGNILTIKVFKFLVGYELTDTQTGLRGIPRNFMMKLMRIKSTGYEFELEMLISTKRNSMKICEVSINTVYENNNETSHFNPILDSLRIYYVFLRFTFLAILTGVMDFMVFAISFTISSNILFSEIIARIVAGTFNFSMGKRYVFQSDGNISAELVKYISLVVTLLIVSYAMITTLVVFLGVNIYISKFIAASILFLSSFAIQNIFVFKRVEVLEK